MQEDHNTTNISRGSDLPQSGNNSDVRMPLGSTESVATSAVNSNPTGGLDELSTPTWAGAELETSSIPAPVAISTDPAASHSDGLVTKPVLKWKGIDEIVRTGNTTITSCKPPFEAEEGSEAEIAAIIQRSELVRSPLGATPAPTGTAKYGSTEELFARLQEAIAAHASVPALTSALLTYWTISTWFTDGLPLAPGLAIIGPPYEGDLVLRTLRNYCRYPLMMTEVNGTGLKNVDWHTPPTLLMFGPTVTKQMASLLGCTTSRGYLVGAGGRYKDYYGAKAVYLGQELSVDRAPRCSVRVHLNPSLARVTQNAPQLTEPEVQGLQNQLLRYRLKNLVRVYNSNFDAPTLTSETRTIANALGACIIDSPKLQSELISLLMPVADQQLTDLSSSLEGITLEATLNLCHEGKTQILAGEIAIEVNRIAKARGERLSYSAEVIGHRLKKVGLCTRRLGKAGKGLVMDLVTTTRLHELAAGYGGVGFDEDNNNLRCQHCTENKPVMQVM